MSDFVNPRDYGLMADDASHPLNTIYGSLSAAQAMYPFAVSLGQEVDYCAVKLASNLAFGADGFENGTNSRLNRKLCLPPGSYRFGNDTWTIRNLGSSVIDGGGKLATTIRGGKTLLAFDGVWYSELSNFSLQCQATDAMAALEIDGNVPGHAYTTRGVQGLTLRNLLIDGGGSNYALTMCRQGGSGAQGSECLFLNLHVQNATSACYYQNGFNSLANTFIGGNFQNYTKHGIWVTGGTVAVVNTGFQSTKGYKQIENGGYDISIGDSGAYESCIIYGCRTESLRFIYNGGAVVTDVRGCSGRVAVPGWSSNTSYGAAPALYKAIVENGLLYVATTEGTTGGVKPTFPLTGSVADGTVIWTQVSFDAAHILRGSIDLTTCTFGAGSIFAPWKDVELKTINSDLVVTSEDIVIVDASGGTRTVELPAVTGVNRGRTITIKKSEISANPVILIGPLENGAASIPGGARGFKTLTWADTTPGGSRLWQVIGTG